MNPPIVLDHLTKQFSAGVFRKSVTAVREISFSVQPGEVVAFLGPNGAGKTTTIKLLLGLLLPTSGSVRLYHSTPEQRSIRKNIGFIPDHPFFYPALTGHQFLQLCGVISGLHNKEAEKTASEWLEKVGLSKDADKKVGEYSRGMLQRLNFAQALQHNPPLLILDEPVLGLDPIGHHDMMELLQTEAQTGKTLFFSTHLLSDVSGFCSRVLIIDQGSILVDTSPQAIFSQQRGKIDVRVRFPGETPIPILTIEAMNNKYGIVHCVAADQAQVNEIIQWTQNNSGEIIEVLERKQSFECAVIDQMKGIDKC
ncbi:MAG: ABC transporter ATP-binding protein [bacterium]|nr:ABC transporter ATP-binding protein [bacterium]